MTLSSLLSATHQSAMLAAEAVADEIDVRVIDTRSVSMGQGFIAVELAELAADGAGLDQLEERCAVLMAKSGVVATLDTLEHLIKGGRVGGAKALLGQVLAIKPLVELKDGVVAEAGRQRTRAKALAAVAATAGAHAPLRRLSLSTGPARTSPSWRSSSPGSPPSSRSSSPTSARWSAPTAGRASSASPGSKREPVTSAP